MEWFIHIVITTVFLLSKKSPWRWPCEWSKHVAYHNTTKYIKIIKVYLLVFNTLYESHTYFRFICIINRKLRTSNICKWDNTNTNTKKIQQHMQKQISRIYHYITTSYWCINEDMHLKLTHCITTAGSCCTVNT